MNGEEEEIDEAPIQWSAPQPAAHEVTEQQQREFEKTYSLKQSQLKDLQKQLKLLQVQRKKLQKEDNDLKNERKQVENNLQNYIQDAEGMLSNLNSKNQARPKSNPSNDITTHRDILEISSLNSNINELKAKSNKLQVKFTEETRLWKVEKKRLTDTLQEQRNEGEIIKQSIEHFAEYMKKDEKSSFSDDDDDDVYNDDLLDPQGHQNTSKSPQISPPKQKLMQTQLLLQQYQKQLIKQDENDDKKFEQEKDDNDDEKDEDDNDDEKRDIKCEFKSEEIGKVRKNNVSDVVVNPDSKLMKILSPPRSPPFQKMREFMPPQYLLDFEYRPRGEPKVTSILKNGKESLFENGDRYIKYRNRTRRITRINGEVYIIFSNGDVSKEFKDGAVAYKFDETHAVQLTLPDKTVHTSFSNGQKEINFPNGDKYIIFPDGSTKYTKANGDFQVRGKDGKIQTSVDMKIITF